MHDQATLIDRRDGPYGEVALRRRGDRFEIIANGCFLMDSSDGRSERALVRAGLDRLERAGGASGASVLIGGLGIGFSFAQASADPRPARIHVVEREQAVIDWHTQGAAPLRTFAGGGHDDPRARVIQADLLDYLPTAADRYDLICLDIDNGPDWTVTEGNRGLYQPAGLSLLDRALADAGVLSVWSAADAPGFRDLLASAFARVTTLEIPLDGDRRGDPDVVLLASRA